MEDVEAEVPAPLEEPRPGGRVQAAVAGAVPLALGGFAAWLSFGLNVGSLTDPGPGLWPLIVAGLLVACGAGVIAVEVVNGGKATEGEAAGDTEAFTRGTVGVVAAAAGLVVYASLFEVVGFEIPTVLLLFVWLRLLGRESWRGSAVIAVAVTAAAYALFILGLGVPLPHLIAF